MDDRIVKFIDCSVGIDACNLRCHYCYITQQKKFNSKIKKIKHSPYEVRQALSRTRLGGICLINMCAGGETLISNDILPIIKELLEEGHYIMVVTNGILTTRFEEICKWDKELLKKLFFKFSFHYLEFKKRNLFECFFNNIKMTHEKGCSFTLEITPSDELIPHIEDVQKMCVDQFGTLCHVTIARDDRTLGIDLLSDMDMEEYKKTWGVFDSELFNYKTEIFSQPRKEFCYAGEWSFYLDLYTGDYKQCYCGYRLGNIYKDPNNPLNLKAIGNHCSLAYCFNGHAFLTLGCIPELMTVTYADIRNRRSGQTDEWLQPEMKAILNQKLYDNNVLYSNEIKMRANFSSFFYSYIKKARIRARLLLLKYRRKI